MSHSSAEHELPSERGLARSAIANAIVRLYAEHFGRGPTRARAQVGDDLVVVLLEDVFTTAERTLVAAGRGEHVARGRAAFAEAMREHFVGAVELATGRRVRAFMSQTHLQPEMAVEIFVLEPDAAA